MNAPMKIQLRRDTLANWTAANPVLLAGEIALETDTRYLRVGDGATAFLSLKKTSLDLSGTGGTSQIGNIDSIPNAVASTASAYLNLQVKGLKKTFGGVGDGVADDTTKWQNAVSSGKTIEIEEGTFNVSAPATMLTPGQHIIGQSRSSIIQCIGDVDALVIGSAGQDSSFVKVDNVYLRGAATGLSSVSAGIRIVRCTRGRFSFVRADSFGYGLTMSGATSNWVNTIIEPYLYQNLRAGLYWLGHATQVIGGEIAGSLFLVCQAALQNTAAVAIDRDFTGTLGEAVSMYGVTLESAGTTQVNVTNAVNNGAGLVRLTLPGHGWQSGDHISVNNVGGTVEANGVWPITVIDANTVDLKTSTFANAFTSGGYARRGYGIYSGIGFGGVHAENLYVEDVPVTYKAGDSFKNDGVTAHTTLTNGGCLAKSYIGNTVQSVALAHDRVDQFVVANNYGSGTSVGLLNARGSNYASEIQHFANYGFARTYETSGGQSGRNIVLRPTTRMGDTVLEVLIPSTMGSSTLVTGFSVSGTADGTYSMQLPRAIAQAFGLGGRTPTPGVGIAYPAVQSPSTDPNTLDDYREGSFLATLTGCTAVLTGTVNYVKTGNQVTLDFPQIIGTSNDANCTITGLPAILIPSAQRSIRMRIYNNSTYVDTASYGNIGVDGTITLYTSNAGATFAAANGKGVLACTATYIL